ncbi:unnamed protein product [Brassica oleracea]
MTNPNFPKIESLDPFSSSSLSSLLHVLPQFNYNP